MGLTESRFRIEVVTSSSPISRKQERNANSCASLLALIFRLCLHASISAGRKRERIPSACRYRVEICAAGMCVALVRAVDAVREDTGARVLGVMVLVDREEGGRERLEKEDLEVVALFKRSDFSVLTNPD